jgi:ElaB/YqjD/DUF883 family membrane-anchored ribosome-binding protein
MDKSRELDRLVSRVEDLLTRLPDDRNPQIADLYDRVDRVILDTWTAVARERAQSRSSMSSIESALDDYVRRRRWSVIGAAALIAGTAGFLAGRKYRRTR